MEIPEKEAKEQFEKAWNGTNTHVLKHEVALLGAVKPISRREPGLV